MTDPVFLELDDVLALHADQITRYGGEAGLRDGGLIQSAIAMPRAQFGGQYLHGSLAEMAAAYVFHLVQNHAFVDGNKRIGAQAALIFLAMNGFWLRAPERTFVQQVLDVAEGRASKADVAVFIQKHVQPY